MDAFPQAQADGRAPWRLAPAWMLGLGALAGVIAFGLLVFEQEGEHKYFGAAVMILLGMVTLPMVRNLRSFTLYMIVLLSPLSLRLTFLPFPHIGGAAALYVEVTDPFLLLLFYFQARDRIRGYRAEYRWPRLLNLWTGMIVLGIGSVIFMGSLRITAINEVVRMLKLLLLAALVVNELMLRQQFRNVVVAIMAGVLLQAGIALAQYIRGRQLGLIFLGESSDEDIKALSDATLLTGDFVYRVGALLGHANLFACYLALFMPVAVALLLVPVSRKMKALMVLVLLLGQPALILTLSRTGWIDFSVALLMVLVLGAANTNSRRKFLFARMAIVVTTVAVALALSPKILQRLYETDPNAVEFRIKWLKTARDMIYDHPVFGMGLNTYVFKQLPYGEDKTPEEMANRYGKIWPVVHNTWVLTWAEQGTVGFILLVWIHLSVIVVGLRNLRIRDPMLHALNVGLLAGIVAVMIDGMASFFIRNEAPARMFWIAIAMILAMGYWRRANEERDPAIEADALQPDEPRAAGRFVPAGSGRWLPARESLLR